MRAGIDTGLGGGVAGDGGGDGDELMLVDGVSTGGAVVDAAAVVGGPDGEVTAASGGLLVHPSSKATAARSPTSGQARRG